MAIKRSDDHYIDLPDGVLRDDMMQAVERAAEAAGLAPQRPQPLDNGA